MLNKAKGQLKSDSLSLVLGNGASTQLTFTSVGFSAGTLQLDLSGVTSTLTLSKNLTVQSGHVTISGNVAGSSVTLPQTGTLATLAGVETLTNKTIVGATISVLDTDSSHNLTLTWNENDSANRTLNLLVGGASRSLSLLKNLTVQTGDVTLTGNAAGSSVTLPTSGTLATLAGVESLSNKTLVTPVLGVATATTINKVTLTAPATSATLTIADGKTLTASNTLTLTGTDGSSVAFGTGGTVAYIANKLSAFAATTSAELAGVISDETGSGSLVFATSPTLTTPVLGAATGTSLTASSSTLSLATVSNGNLSLTAHGSGNVALSSTTGKVTSDRPFEVSGTSSYIKFPSLTTTQRDAIATPTVGMTIYNTTTSAYEAYSGSGWAALGGGGGGITALTGDVTASGSGSVAATIAANVVTNAKFRQGAGLSVVGVAGNAAANVADIVGTAGQTLRVSGTTLGFGALDLTLSAAVTGALPLANGGTGQTTAANALTALLPSQTGNNGKVLQSNGTSASWQTVGGGSLPVLPSVTGTQTLTDWTALLTAYTRNVNTNTKTSAITHTTAVGYAYQGAVYSPTQNRIYLVPSYQGASGETTWHYIDCNTGETVEYTHGAFTVSSAYYGGVYAPTQNRIYLVPFGMSAQSTWYYIDCATGDAVAYTHGATVTSFAYQGGVYSPTQNRIYFVPSGQAGQSDWHYVDCSNANPGYGVATITSYTHGTSGSKKYIGGVYSPTQNRIYFVPAQSGSSNSNWHYVDCSNGNIVAYAHGATTTTGQIYNGGAYSPTQNRIYFAPKNQQDQANWHYVDCSNGNIVAYAHGLSTVYYEHEGAVYMPTTNRIYFMPTTIRVGNSYANKYIYLNCSSGAIEEYPGIYKRDGSQFPDGGAAQAGCGGAYSPTEDRIYFGPCRDSAYELWYYIAGSGVRDNICSHLFGSTLLSSTV